MNRMLSAAVEKLGCIEAEVWTRACPDIPFPHERDQRRPYFQLLEASMEPAEQRLWRALCITVMEMLERLGRLG